MLRSLFLPPRGADWTWLVRSAHPAAHRPAREKPVAFGDRFPGPGAWLGIAPAKAWNMERCSVRCSMFHQGPTVDSAGPWYAVHRAVLRITPAAGPGDA
jgi:hypothetical protein